MQISARLPVIGRAARDASHFDVLFEANPNVMWISDAATLKILAANEAAVACYGYSRDEFLRLRVPDLLPEEERETLLAAADQAPGPRYLRNVPRIWRHRTRRGETLLVEVTRYPIVWQGRDARLTLVSDVSARIAREVRLRDEIDALKAQLEAMRADVAAARTLAEAMPPGTNARAQELARLLAANAARVTVDLADIAEHEIHLLRLAEPLRRVHVDIDPELLCAADPAIVRPLVRELLANAWKATAGCTNPWIRMGRGVASGEGEALFIADNGEGFDESRLAHGLGLAIAAAAVRRHNGRLWAQSAPGEGATFLFTLAQAPTGT